MRPEGKRPAKLAVAALPRPAPLPPLAAVLLSRAARLAVARLVSPLPRPPGRRRRRGGRTRPGWTGQTTPQAAAWCSTARIERMPPAVRK